MSVKVVIRPERGCHPNTEVIKVMRRCVSQTLIREGIHDECEVFILITSDEGMRIINERARGVDRPTDVLSFPTYRLRAGSPPVFQEKHFDPDTGRVMLGEIVISLERAKEQAASYRHSIEREMGFLTVHAVLHILGYDHETGEEDERVMFARQDEILNLIGLGREND